MEDEAHLTLEDEREIVRVLTRYCELLDTGQAERIAEEVFAENAIADYKSVVLEGRSEIGHYLVTNVTHFAQTAHAISNISITVCGDGRVEVGSMMTAWHWIPTPPDKRTDDVVVRLVMLTDHLVRVADGWRVSQRQTRAIGGRMTLTTLPSDR
jgi:hypothetical protein